MKRTLILYSGARLALLVLSIAVIIPVIGYYYSSWRPPGLRDLLSTLRALGYGDQIKTPSGLLDATRKVAPKLTSHVKRVLILAPYDSIESGLAMFVAPPSIMLHGLVVLLVTLYASVLHEIGRTGVYGVYSAATGSRTRLLSELLRSHMLLTVIVASTALSPLLVVGLANPWTGWRGPGPVALVYLTALVAVVAETMLYTMVATIMVERKLFYESILLTIVSIYIVPALLIASAALLSGHGTVVKLVFVSLVALLPLHAAPGLLYEAVKHGADMAASQYLHAGPEPLLSTMGFTVSLLAMVFMVIYSRRLLERHGVPW